MELNYEQRKRAYMRPMLTENIKKRNQIFWSHYKAADPNEMKHFFGFQRTHLSFRSSCFATS